MALQAKKRAVREELLDKCLTGFVAAGTLDLSLDELADRVGISKRMLIHYFGSRENLELRVLSRLEDTLRRRFAPESFSPRSSVRKVVLALWEQSTAAETRSVLRLVMDITKRAWSGSGAARGFYATQQQLWIRLLLNFAPDRAMAEAILIMFQGAVLAFLITGDARPGKRALMEIVANHGRGKK